MTDAETGHINRSLGRVEGKIDLILTEIQAMNKRHDDLEGRVVKVEHKQWWAAGAGAAVVALIGFVGRLFHA